MAGFKDFADGNVLTGAEIDGYLQRQTIMRFPTTASLTATLGISSGVREHGMMAWADDVSVLYVFSSLLTAWIPWESTMKTFLTQGSSGGTNWTNGNATQFGQWRYSGGMVKWTAMYAVGSTSNLQTGVYAWTVPVRLHASLTDGYPIGQLVMKDSPATYYCRTLFGLGNDAFCAAYSEANVRSGTTTPIAVSTGDQFSINAHYHPYENVWLT